MEVLSAIDDSGLDKSIASTQMPSGLMSPHIELTSTKLRGSIKSTTSWYEDYMISVIDYMTDLPLSDDYADALNEIRISIDNLKAINPD